MMPDGWGYVIAHGHVTMLEVSLNLPEVTVNDFHLLPTQSQTVRSWSNVGKLETLVLGKPNGNQTRVYNRTAKRKANKQYGSQYAGTRLERVLRPGTPLPLVDLPQLHNPFAVLDLVVMPLTPPPDEHKPYIWELFTDSVARRTLPVALKLLPEDKRTLYRKWLKLHPVGWWEPNQIWNHWPQYLAQTGLSDYSQW